MISFVQTLLFTTAVGAALRSRQVNDGCCFQLASVGMVNETVLEDHVGDLLLGGTFQQGGFCLDKTTKTIQDSLGHNCFMRGPDYQFECYQGAVGTTAFDIAPPKADGKSRLTYDNDSGVFYACPIDSESYDIYSSDKADKTGTPNPTVTTRQSSPQKCAIDPSAPSLAPYQLRHGNSSVPSGSNDTSAEVLISRNYSTMFDYDIPSTFPPANTAGKSSLCALQFRMPVCTSLPKGYPCYSFSGLEQEVLSNSGMTFHLVDDDGNATWNSTELHQVFPGENTTIGTFECGQAAGYDESRKMSWHVSSVRDFSLEFLQAGVGQSAQFQNGIGAWIVPCQ
ncbi:putative gpi anchored cell wall protein [Daldinia childiae]|uniref:putative gpi anchored cell wall protein n=1 Tax=Daldinia childiae TaxID=326645 RepID=UPI0014479036|nr:putative gpi anchored cell wall protein [Daldinia childiae]KAF3058397.1 putative gpi anchored cell wall protein [Daldinia childiae]